MWFALAHGIVFHLIVMFMSFGKNIFQKKRLARFVLEQEKDENMLLVITESSLT